MPVLSGTILTVILVVIAVWVIASCIRVVPQATAMVVERFGAYQATWDVGIHFKAPFIDRVAKKVTLKASQLKKKAQKVKATKAMTVANNQGAITYGLAGVSKKKFNSYVKKLKKGKKIKVTATKVDYKKKSGKFKVKK